MRSLKILTMAAALTLGLSSAAKAQAPSVDPRFPSLGKSVFAVGSQYATQAVMPSPVGLNPATQNFLLDVAQPTSFEVDYGLFETRSDFTLGVGIANVMMPLGKKSSLRLSGYGLWSNSKPIPITGPASIEHDGTAVELSYAYRLNNQLDIGAAFVPHDSVESRLTLGTTVLGTGSAESNFQARLGALWHSANKKLRVGAVYSTDSIGAESRTTDRAGKWKGSFLQRSWTAGVSYDVRPGSTLFYNYQSLNFKGEGVDLDRPSSYWGVQQFITPQVVLRYARATQGNEISLGYVGKVYEAYVSYNDRGFGPASDIYGRGSLLFLSGVRKF